MQTLFGFLLGPNVKCNSKGDIGPYLKIPLETKLPVRDCVSECSTVPQIHTPTRYVKGEDDILSNFYRVDINIYGKTFKSVEHAYQWKKAIHHNEDDKAETILAIDDVKMVKALGGTIQGDYNWSQKKLEYMAELLKAKYDQVQAFREELKSTRDYTLKHNTADSWWGTGKDGNGLDVFGKLLTELQRETWNESKTVSSLCDVVRETIKDRGTYPLLSDPPLEQPEAIIRVNLLELHPSIYEKLKQSNSTYTDVEYALLRHWQGYIKLDLLDKMQKQNLENVYIHMRDLTWHTHQIYTKDTKGIITTPHQSSYGVQSGGSYVCVKTRHAEREYNKYTQFVQQVPELKEFFPVHELSEDKTKVFRYGMTPLTLGDLETIVRSGSYVTEDPDLHISLYDYCVEYLGYKELAPCKVPKLHCCEKCHTFMTFMGNHLNYLWCRHKRLVELLRKNNISANLPVDDIDLSGKYVDYESYGKKDMLRIEYCTCFHLLLQAVWAQFYLNEIFMHPDTADIYTLLSEERTKELELLFLERRNRVARDNTTYIPDELVNDLVKQCDINLKPEENALHLTVYMLRQEKFRPYLQGKQLVNLEILPNAVVQELNKLAPNTLDRVSFELFYKFYLLEEWLNTKPINIWDFKPGDSVQDMHTVTLQMAWRSRYDTHSDAYCIACDYENGDSIQMGGNTYTFPSSIYIPGIGPVPYRSPLTCTDTCCKDLTMDDRKNLAYVQHPTGSHFTVPTVDRTNKNYTQIAVYGTMSDAYCQRTHVSQRSSAADMEFEDFLQENGINLVRTPEEVQGDQDVFLAFKYYPQLVDNMADEYKKYEQNYIGSLTDAVLLMTLDYSLLISTKSEDTAKLVNPQYEHEYRDETEQILKNPRNSAGYPGMTYGNAQDLRNVFGERAIKANLDHAKKYAVCNYINITGKVALSKKSNPRVIQGCGPMAAYFARATSQGTKCIEALKAGGTIEGPMFYNGTFNKHIHALNASKVPAEERVTQDDDAKSFDKNVDFREQLLEDIKQAFICKPKEHHEVTRQDILHISLNDTINNFWGYDVFEGNVTQRHQGVSSGNAKTKLNNNGINLKRKIAGEIDNLLRSYSGVEEYDNFRNNFSKFYFRPPGLWNSKEILQLVSDFLTYVETYVVRWIFAGDDSGRNGTPLLCQNNRNMALFMRQYYNIEMEEERFHITTSAAPIEFCSHRAVYSEELGYLACPRYDRVICSAFYTLSSKSIQDIMSKIMNLALVAYPLRYDDECPTVFKHLTELLFKYLGRLCQQYGNVMDVKDVMPGTQEFFSTPDGSTRPLHELTDIERVHNLYKEKPENFSVFLDAPMGTKNEALQHVPKVSAQRCDYCGDVPFLVCDECKIVVNMCQYCAGEHYAVHGHYKHTAYGKMIKCVRCDVREDLTICGEDYYCKQHTKDIGVPLFQDGRFHYRADQQEKTLFCPQHIDECLECINTLANDHMHKFVQAMYQNIRTHPLFFLKVLYWFYKLESEADQLQVFKITHVDITKQTLMVSEKLVWNKRTKYVLKQDGKIVGNVILSPKTRGDTLLLYYRVDTQVTPCVGDTLEVAQDHGTSSQFMMHARQFIMNGMLRGMLNTTADIKKEEQLEAFLVQCTELDEERCDIIRSAVHNNMTFVQGCPGSGKTHLSVRLINYLVSSGKTVLVLAPSHAATDVICNRALQTDIGRYVARNFPKDHSERCNVHSSVNYLYRYSYARVLCSTLKTNVPDSFQPDYILIDESSLACDVDIVYALSRYHLSKVKVTFIGDYKQLPPVHKFQVPLEFSNLYNHVCLVRGANVFKLRRQFRMHPQICEFISNKYYKGTLKTDDNYTSKIDYPFHRVIKIKGKYTPTRSSSSILASIHNDTEVSMCYLYSWLHNVYPGKSIAVYCTYNGTVALLSEHLNATTIDSAQGSESDIVIIATTNDGNHSLSDNRMNVAISRAKELCIILIPDSKVSDDYFDCPSVELSQILLWLDEQLPIPQLKNESQFITSKGRVDVQAMSKWIAPNILIGDSEVADIPTSDLFAVDVEARHWVIGDACDKSIPAISQVGYAYAADKYISMGQDRYCKPQAYKFDPISQSIVVSEDIPSNCTVFPKRDGQQLFSEKQRMGMRNAKNTQDIITRSLLTEFVEKSKLKVCFLVWNYQLELKWLIPYLDTTPETVCFSCGSRETICKVSCGYVCRGCYRKNDVGYRVEKLVNAVMYDVQQHFPGKRLGNVHECNDCSGVEHNPCFDAKMTLCIFMRKIRPTLKPSPCVPLHAPYRFFASKKLREAQAIAAKQFVANVGAKTVLDIGVGPMRQHYDLKCNIINVEPNPTTSTYARCNKKQQSLYVIPYEEMMELPEVDAALAFQVLHHLPENCLKEKEILASLYLRDDMPVRMLYSWAPDEKRFHTLGTNNLYCNEHFTIAELQERNLAYDIKLFEFGKHVCDHGSELIVLEGVDYKPQISLPCIIRLEHDMNVAVAGYTSCVDTYLQSHHALHQAKTNEMPLTFIQLTRKFTEEVKLVATYTDQELKQIIQKSENESLDAYQFDGKTEIKPSFDLPGYATREKLPAFPMGVPNSRGFNKLLQLLYTVIQVIQGVLYTKSILLIGGSSHRWAPMSVLLRQLFPRAYIRMVDPVYVPTQSSIDAYNRLCEPEDLCEGGDLLISDAYDSTGLNDLVSLMVEAKKKYRIALIKVTQTFSAWEELEKFCAFYKNIRLFRPAITGISSEAWVCVWDLNEGEMIQHEVEKRYWFVIREVTINAIYRTLQPVEVAEMSKIKKIAQMTYKMRPTD